MVPRASGLLRVLVWVGIAAGIVQGCGGSDEEELRAARLNEGCLLDSDCTDPFVCVFRRCHKQCESTKDCSDGERCVLGEQTTHVCQSHIPCSYNSQCPGAQVCGVDGKCRD